jgi:CheY-like chemotaxis protein
MAHSTPADSKLDPREESRSSRLAKGGPRPAVLVVDDDDDARLIWSECLAHLGYEARCEINGDKAIYAALRAPPVAILMDVAMPGLDGIQATRRIKSEPRTRACLVILVSAKGTAMFADAKAAGCDACFAKPFDPFSFGRIFRMLTSPPPQRTRAPTAARCACNRLYTSDQWASLALKGVVQLPTTREVYEVRACPCGSSIAIPIAMTPPSNPPLGSRV